MSTAFASRPCTRFSVSGIDPATEPFETIAYGDRIAERLARASGSGAVESFSRETRELVRHEPAGHSLISALALACSGRLPVSLSPDHVWLTLAQGAASHVHLAAAMSASRSVTVEGRKVLHVLRDQFVKGFDGNDWEGVAADFSGQIREIVGDARHELLVQSFSTTGMVERTAGTVAQMQLVEGRFAADGSVFRGIPSIALEGTEEDWSTIREAAERFVVLGLQGWTSHLLPMLDQFELAASGRIDRSFWPSFFKLTGMGAESTVSGHVVNLFPYLVDRTGVLVQSPHLGARVSGPSLDEFPTGLSSAPFTWDNGSRTFEMEFVAGFVGVAQDEETLTLRPHIGWAVRDR
ncbi:MAG: DUF4419 domain-containing protein [Capsulimonadaceae bacterium]